jgi:hypothetical protein
MAEPGSALGVNSNTCHAHLSLRPATDCLSVRTQVAKAAKSSFI